MRRFRAAASLAGDPRSPHFHFLRHCRSFCRSSSLPEADAAAAAAAAASADGLESQVLVQGSGSSRTAILNRPSVLNAFSTAMGAKLQKLYKNWEDDPDIGFVMMKWQGILRRGRCC